MPGWGVRVRRIAGDADGSRALPGRGEGTGRRPGRYLRRNGNESPAPTLKPRFLMSKSVTTFASPSV